MVCSVLFSFALPKIFLSLPQATFFITAYHRIDPSNNQPRFQLTRLLFHNFNQIKDKIFTFRMISRHHSKGQKSYLERLYFVYQQIQCLKKRSRSRKTAWWLKEKFLQSMIPSLKKLSLISESNGKMKIEI